MTVIWCRSVAVVDWSSSATMGRAQRVPGATATDVSGLNMSIVVRTQAAQHTALDSISTCAMDQRAWENEMSGLPSSSAPMVSGYRRTDPGSRLTAWRRRPLLACTYPCSPRLDPYPIMPFVTPPLLISAPAAFVALTSSSCLPCPTKAT